MSDGGGETECRKMKSRIKRRGAGGEGGGGSEVSW
jgi:hypothetical protein